MQERAWSDMRVFVVEVLILTRQRLPQSGAETKTETETETETQTQTQTQTESKA